MFSSLFQTNPLLYFIAPMLILLAPDSGFWVRAVMTLKRFDQQMYPLCWHIFFPPASSPLLFELIVWEPWGWQAHRPEALLPCKHFMVSTHFTLSSSSPCVLEQPDKGLCNWNPLKQHLYLALISNPRPEHLSPRPQGPVVWLGMILRNTNATKYLQLSHLFFMVGFLLPRTRFGEYEPPRSLQIFEPIFLHKSSRRIQRNNGAVTLFRLSWFYGTNSTTIVQKLMKYQDVNSMYLYRQKYHYHFW